MDRVQVIPEFCSGDKKTYTFNIVERTIQENCKFCLIFDLRRAENGKRKY
jgi:hypothetical protein